jgi:hypothetical protein
MAGLPTCLAISLPYIWKHRVSMRVIESHPKFAKGHIVNGDSI